MFGIIYFFDLRKRVKNLAEHTGKSTQKEFVPRFTFGAFNSLVVAASFSLNPRHEQAPAHPALGRRAG
ncbi:MAG TPA: hypothetical protein VIK35_01615, partial [Verrucomicrobiae bacterium]